MPLPEREYSNNIMIRVEEVATKRGISMAQVATAWVLSKEGVTAPIIGTTNLKNLEDILGESVPRRCDRPVLIMPESYSRHPH